MRVMVATDRSETARQAVAWAADLARGTGGELILLQVLPEPVDGSEERLRRDALELGGARAVVTVDPDVAGAIVRASEAEAADVLVVGNAGMGGRTEFLLGNVPNRISHAARCTVVIVNTTDGRIAEAVVEADDEAEGRLLGRAAEIGRVLARFGLDARRADSPADRARSMRAPLEQLGPTFAKLGQILSTRPDLVPPEVAEELAKLQDDVAPLTEAEVVHVMEQELRVPWEDVFESIEPTPLAAGTIGQVHRATLEGGESVVVKVQRPGAREQITRDLGLLELFAERALEQEALRGAVVRLHLHPYLRWQGEDGKWLRGRTTVLERLRSGGTPRPPASVELRDGQVYRWFAATGDGGPGGRADGAAPEEPPPVAVLPDV